MRIKRPSAALVAVGEIDLTHLTTYRIHFQARVRKELDLWIIVDVQATHACGIIMTSLTFLVEATNQEKRLGFPDSFPRLSVTCGGGVWFQTIVVQSSLHLKISDGCFSVK